jgi:hypothetical protein
MHVQTKKIDHNNSKQFKLLNQNHSAESNVEPHSLD